MKPEEVVKLAEDTLHDMKALDVRLMDVRNKSSVSEYLLIASGSSSRHVKAIAEEVARRAKQANYPPLGMEGERTAEWVLVDLNDVVVHVMQPRVRDFYNLEKLWEVDLSHFDDDVKAS